MRDEYDDFSKAALVVVSIVARNGYITLDELSDLAAALMRSAQNQCCK